MPPATPSSAPTRPPVCEKTRIINATPTPFTPRAQNRACDFFEAPTSLTSSITSDCQSRTTWRAAVSKSGLARRSSAPAPASSSRPAG